MTRQTVILIDAKNALFRFGWAFRYLSAEDGTRTGAVFGTLNCMLRLKAKYPDARFVLVWDGVNPSAGWRGKLFDGYKSNRKGDKPVFVVETEQQIPMLKEIVSLLGVHQVSVESVEADDLIGILAARCINRGYQPVVYSSDKDFLQLMVYGVAVIRDVNKATKLAPETDKTVQKLFGCTSDDVLFVRTFLRDASDRIPSPMRGCGPAGALKLIAAGVDPSLPSYSELHRDVRRALKNTKVAENWEAIHRNYRLVRIPLTVSNAEFPAWQRDRLRNVVRDTMYHLHATAMVDQYPKSAAKRYKRLLARLSGLQMEMALAKRTELWQLQK